MTEIRRLLSESQGTPLTSFIQSGFVEERTRSLVGERGTLISVHYDRAAQLGVAETRSHAFCLSNKIFLGPAVGNRNGPTLSEALHHELVHVAQVELARRTGRVSSTDCVEHEAVRLARDRSMPLQISHGANPEQIYTFWWLIPLAAAAYVLLRPNVANAPGPNDKTYPAVSEAQVGGEALALFAVPEASFGIAGRLGLGYWGSMAVAGASSTMSFRAVGDVSTGEFSGVQTYVIDGATGAIIGVVVPGGIKLVGTGATRSLDWLATQGLRQSDFAITEILAQRSAQTPVTAEELAKIFQSRSSSGKAAEWWLNRRGLILLYRGQGMATTTILSPVASTGGVGTSEELVAQMRAAGLSDSEIAHKTAFWSNNPVPPQLAPLGLGWQPLGGAGIPMTRIPGVAADFAETRAGDMIQQLGSHRPAWPQVRPVVYIIRLPKNAVIQVPPWGMSVEHEWVILNQVPYGAVIDAVPATSLPTLTVDASGRLIPGIARGTTAAATDLSKIPGLHNLKSRRLPLFGAPPLFNLPVDPPKRKSPPPNPPGAGTVTEQTFCWRPNSDYIDPVCTTTKIYMVKNGDSLWALAHRFYGDGNQYKRIYEANKGVLGSNPNKPHLIPGQRLTIP
jgi:hypothetical protein